MKRIDKQKTLEQVIYLVIWLIIFLMPVVGGLLASYNSEVGEMFSWRVIRTMWLATLPFFLLFIANNYLLAPRLLFRKRFGWYALSIIGAIVLLFIVYPYVGGHRPFEPFNNSEFSPRDGFRPGGPDDRFRPNDRPGSRSRTATPSPEDFGPGQAPGADNRRPPEGEGFTPGEGMPGFPGEEPQMAPGNDDSGKERMTPQKPRFSGNRPPDDFKRAPFPVPLVSRLAMAFLLVGFNIGIKLMFKSLRDEERMKELEHEHLQSELEYLKYQINPHFFMNTLNNIHALVDIDTEKAQRTILELSKMMRYVLYEASRTTISLVKEVQFLKHYVELMRLRCTDKVKITIAFPTEVPDVQIPPLLFISFVENAFKHGVSHQHESYIDMTVTVEEGRLVFRCSNSCFGKSDDQHHGIGLENVQKRLKLLFNNNYTLSIHDGKERFEVLLIIPLV